MANIENRREASNTEKRRIYSNYDIELHGNAVRQTVILPDDEPELRPKRKRVTSEEIERIQKETNERAFGLKSFMLVMTAVLFLCVSLVMYLTERGNLHSHTKTVKNLTQELNEKTVLNNNRATAIEASIDYTEIYNRAIKELNMTFPGKEQVLWFSTTESEYISQYEEIPQKY